MNRESTPPDTLPCPWCDAPVAVSYGLTRWPFRCERCERYSAFPMAARLLSAAVAVGIALAAVLALRWTGLAAADSLLEIALLAGVLVGALYAIVRWVAWATRATASRLVRLRRPVGFPRPGRREP